jgi:TolA-binding protein
MPLERQSWVVISRAVLYGASALLVAGAYLYIRWESYNDGVADTTTKYENLILKERQRVNEANSAALAEARSKISELQSLLRERNEKLSDLQREAAQDRDVGTFACRAD